MTRRADPRAARLPVPTGELPPFAPVPRQTSRHDGWTEARQRAFIEALADTGSVAAACKAVNMSTVGAYYLRRQPGAESFRAAWEAALQLGVQRIEDVAMERALNGVDVPVYSYGKLVGMRTSYNDRLLMFILRNRAPDRFADGRAKAMNALDRAQLKRLKKQWRKEWEAQLPQRQVEDAAQARKSIAEKLERLRQTVLAQRAREWELLSSEARAAHAEYERLRERDLRALGLPGSADAQPQAAKGRPPVAPYGAQPSEPDGSRPALEGPDKQNREYIEYSQPPEKAPPPEPWDGIRRLKDEGWE